MMHDRAHDHAEDRENPGSSDDDRGRRSGRRTAVLALLVAGLLALTSTTAVARVRPLVNGDVPDPSIAQTKSKHYVVVGTGAQVLRLSSTNGRTWRLASPALLTRPAWSRATGDIWASDIVRLRGRWVLYYSAPVRGLASSSRCIGVAVARVPTGRYQPLGTGPLVCPPGADAPAAGDPVLDPGRSEPTLPTVGAIDPSVYQGPSGPWLL